MAKLRIQPHGRLQEWVAHENGYFNDEGLDYIFADQLNSKDGKVHDLGNKVGAYQTFETGRTCDVSSACHWTVNVAAAAPGRKANVARSFSPSPGTVSRRVLGAAGGGGGGETDESAEMDSFVDD